jgi:PleD family two-component response regulator
VYAIGCIEPQSNFRKHASRFGVGFAKSSRPLLRFMNSVAAVKRVLIVGPDRALPAGLMTLAARMAHVEGCDSFKAARAQLEGVFYDLVVTDARLSEYNGLHLVYLAQSAHTAAHAIVYDREGDLGVAADVRRAGAFFEVAARLLVTLPAYLAAPLPPTDRRSPAALDRRRLPRGGRRLWDRHLLERVSPAP